VSLVNELLSTGGPEEKLSMLSALMPQQGGGGMPGSAPTTNSLSDFVPGEGASQAEARRIAQWIQSRPGTNFSIGGLEGYKGTGQISTGHIENSQHYTGNAGDVSYVGGKRFDAEPAALDWLYNRLQQKFGDDLTELIWRAPDHYDHLHYGTRPGG
jgi:hypothetical protein